LTLLASEDFHMTTRFPGPWRIAEFPNGFAVYDATDRQLGFFYGRTDMNMAGHGGFLMIDDARQIAVDFARLPELLNQTSDQSEVATPTEGDKLRPDGQSCPQMLRRPSDRRSIRTKFLIPIAAAALPVGYLYFGDPDPPVSVAVVPRVTADRLSAEFSPLQEAKAPLFKATDITIGSRIGPEGTDSTVAGPIEPKIHATFQPTVPLDIKPTENGIEAGPPPQKEGSLTPSQDASTCFPSASAVRRNYPEGRPSWTLRAPGHEGTRCWYAANPSPRPPK
jgi:hypothetical protein